MKLKFHQIIPNYTWVESVDDADGFIPQKRLGFLVK